MSTPAQIRPDDAVAQNAKLFPILARRLDTTDQTQYTSAAGKLQKWLDSEKAYYPAARPKIVELLEIAWKASRDLAPQAFEHGKPPDRSTYPISKLPTFDAYITLIGTIRQYIRLFSEDDLIQRLRILLVSAGFDVDPRSSTPIAQRPEPPVVATHTLPTALSSSSSSSAQGETPRTDVPASDTSKPSPGISTVAVAAPDHLLTTPGVTPMPNSNRVPWARPPVSHSTSDRSVSSAPPTVASSRARGVVKDQRRRRELPLAQEFAGSKQPSTIPMPTDQPVTSSSSIASVSQPSASTGAARPVHSPTRTVPLPPWAPAQSSVNGSFQKTRNPLKDPFKVDLEQFKQQKADGQSTGSASVITVDKPTTATPLQVAQKPSQPLDPPVPSLVTTATGAQLSPLSSLNKPQSTPTAKETSSSGISTAVNTSCVTSTSLVTIPFSTPVTSPTATSQPTHSVTPPLVQSVPSPSLHTSIVQDTSLKQNLSSSSQSNSPVSPHRNLRVGHPGHVRGDSGSGLPSKKLVILARESTTESVVSQHGGENGNTTSNSASESTEKVPSQADPNTPSKKSTVTGDPDEIPSTERSHVWPSVPSPASAAGGAMFAEPLTMSAPTPRMDGRNSSAGKVGQTVSESAQPTSTSSIPASSFDRTGESMDVDPICRDETAALSTSAPVSTNASGVPSAPEVLHDLFNSAAPNLRQKPTGRKPGVQSQGVTGSCTPRLKISPKASTSAKSQKSPKSPTRRFSPKHHLPTAGSPYAAGSPSKKKRSPLRLQLSSNVRLEDLAGPPESPTTTSGFNGVVVGALQAALGPSSPPAPASDVGTSSENAAPSTEASRSLHVSNETENAGLSNSADSTSTPVLSSTRKASPLLDQRSPAVVSAAVNLESGYLPEEPKKRSRSPFGEQERPLRRRTFTWAGSRMAESQAPVQADTSFAIKTRPPSTSMSTLRERLVVPKRPEIKTDQRRLSTMGPPQIIPSRAESAPPIAVKNEEPEDMDEGDDDEMIDELAPSYEPNIEVSSIVAVESGRQGYACFEMKIELHEKYWAVLSKWTSATRHTDDVTKAMCISLACYRRHEVPKLPPPQLGVKLDNVFAHITPVPWTDIQGLTATVNESVDLVFPPFVPAVDDMYDLSKFLKVGENKIKFIQTRDQSKYLFVVQAHHPTRSQLQEINGIREEDEKWKTTLSLCTQLARPSLKTLFS